MEGSRERLGAESIDLYQIHWPVPCDPIVAAAANQPFLEAAPTLRPRFAPGTDLAKQREILQGLKPGGAPLLREALPKTLEETGPSWGG